MHWFTLIVCIKGMSHWMVQVKPEEDTGLGLID
jgi:hypothetical protein